MIDTQPARRHPATDIKNPTHICQELNKIRINNSKQTDIAAEIIRLHK